MLVKLKLKCWTWSKEFFCSGRGMSCHCVSKVMLNLYRTVPFWEHMHVGIKKCQYFLSCLLDVYSEPEMGNSQKNLSASNFFYQLETYRYSVWSEIRFYLTPKVSMTKVAGQSMTFFPGSERMVLYPGPFTWRIFQ